MIALGRTTTIHTKAAVRVPRWDRIVARFLAGKTQLPTVTVNRVTHARHASTPKHSKR
jgi:hypothetical protein